MAASHASAAAVLLSEEADDASVVLFMDPVVASRICLAASAFLDSMASRALAWLMFASCPIVAASAAHARSPTRAPPRRRSRTPAKQPMEKFVALLPTLSVTPSREASLRASPKGRRLLALVSTLRPTLTEPDTGTVPKTYFMGRSSSTQFSGKAEAVSSVNPFSGDTTTVPVDGASFIVSATDEWSSLRLSVAVRRRV